MTDYRHSRGALGEATMGFHLGEKGYVIIDGPGGSAGHQVNRRGFDGIAYHPKLRRLLIYDNKATTTTPKISSATSVDSRKNLEKNLESALRRVEAFVPATLPNKAHIRLLLLRALEATRSGTRWPNDVTLAVTNAAGNAEGVSNVLAGLGVRFLPVTSLGSRVGALARNPDVAGAVGQWIGDACLLINDYFVRKKVEEKLQELRPDIERILLAGDGVLIIIALEKSMRDDAGRQLTMFRWVSLQPGQTRNEAVTSWRAKAKIYAAPLPGAKLTEEYQWIPPPP